MTLDVLFPTTAQLLDFAGISLEHGEPSLADDGTLFHVHLVPTKRENFRSDDLVHLCSSFDENREHLLRQADLEEKQFEDLMSHVGLLWVRLGGANGSVVDDRPRVR